MKKMLMIAILAAFAQAGFAAMDDRDYSVAVIGTATNSQSFVLRGELEAVYVTIPASATGTVTVATSQGTVFTKSALTASGVYFPRVALQTTAGAAATFVGGTNNTANAWYGKAPLAGSVTVTVIGESEGTNTYGAKIIYNK